MSDLVKKIKQDQEINDFLNENQLSIEDNLILLCSYYSKKSFCLECDGLMCCKQAIVGYHPYLVQSNNRVVLEYEPCKYQKINQKEIDKKNNLVLVSCTFDNYNFDNVFQTPERKNVLGKIKKVYEAVSKGEKTKGLYIHGSYGNGKSYLLAYLAHRLVQINKKVVFAYYPDLVRQIKSSIGSGDLEDYIEELKEAECLILDDIGGEQNTDFIRDEVLGAILQERMMKGLLTCMTSNLPPKMLRDHLSNGNREIDDLKAARICERINNLMDSISLDDTTNYR